MISFEPKEKEKPVDGFKRVYFEEYKKEFDEICQVLDRHCVKLTDKQIPVAHLTSEQIAADVRKWNEYGRAFIQNSILPILPVFNL